MSKKKVGQWIRSYSGWGERIRSFMNIYKIDSEGRWWPGELQEVGD